jgi:hypothetical protein
VHLQLSDVSNYLDVYLGQLFGGDDFWPDLSAVQLTLLQLTPTLQAWHQTGLTIRSRLLGQQTSRAKQLQCICRREQPLVLHFYF